MAAHRTRDRFIENRWFTAAIVFTIVGGMVLFFFAMWCFFVVADYRDIPLFFSSIFGYGFVGVTLGGIAVGLRAASLYQRKGMRAHMIAGCCIAIVANAAMMLGCARELDQYYAVRLVFMSTDRLIVLLEDPAYNANAAYRLGQRRAGGAMPPLTQVVKNKNAEGQLRRNAVRALGKICDRRYPITLDTEMAFSALTDVLKDDDDQLVLLAAEALGGMRDERALEPLLEVVMNSTRGENTRIRAAAGFPTIGGPKAYKMLHAFERQMNAPPALADEIKRFIRRLEAEEALNVVRDSLNQ